MDTDVILKIKQINDAFYRENAESFSRTRERAWSGWDHVAESLLCAPSSVLDIACGNMRFKSYLEQRFGAGAFSYYGVDSCRALLPDGNACAFQEVDLIDALLANGLAEKPSVPPCDLTVCFGFLHHVPSFALRAELMTELLGMTAEGGVVAISFWQFAEDAKHLEKALRTTKRFLQANDLDLEENDFILDWQEKTDAFRYCHSFTDGEIIRLLESCAPNAQVVAQFKADGKTGRLNAYAVLRKL